MNTGNCPSCGRPWPETRGRICSLCELPILLHHRWRFVGSRVQHRDCQDPTLDKLVRPAEPRLVEVQDGD